MLHPGAVLGRLWENQRWIDGLQCRWVRVLQVTVVKCFETSWFLPRGKSDGAGEAAPHAVLMDDGHWKRLEAVGLTGDSLFVT